MKDSRIRILIINLTTYVKSVFLIIALLFTVGCGGWFKEDVTGQFIDGPVAGLTYICSSGKVGVTKNDGKYTCKSGDTVAFKVGDIFLGSATAGSTVTPVTLYPDNPEAATNVAQLLQTLDDDGDLSSFVIDEAKAAKLSILDVTSSSFDASAENMLGTPLVDASSAVVHMNESIAALPGEKLPTLVVPDPVVTDPVVADPVVTDPVVTDPVVTDPIVTDPVVADPVVTDPIVTDPVVADPVVTDPIVTAPMPVDPVIVLCEIGPAMQEGQVLDSTSKLPLQGVEVSINGCTTTTDADGYYTLDNIVENENAVVNIEKEGYLLGSTKIQIKELSGDSTPSPNYLEYAIDTYDYQWSYDSQTSASGANIYIPASVYTDAAGDLYTGTVAVALEIQDVTKEPGKTLFPGSFEGQNTNGGMQQFVSHGLISLSFKDTNGNPLNFSEGTIATLTFDAVSSMEGANIIPLWYYDYLQGLWIEEGYAELQVDGTYQGRISHPGTWSLSQPIEGAAGIYIDRILYPDGTPVKNLRVHAVGENWIRTDLSTDENGVFEIEVTPGKEFTLKAYHYTDKYSATYNSMISAIASGEIANKIN